MRSSTSPSCSACTRRENSPGERPHRTARRQFGRRIDQVGDRLGLREIESVVQEGALRELAGRGDAQAERAAGLQAALDHEPQHDRPAVPLQLEHVLAGI